MKLFAELGRMKKVLLLTWFAVCLVLFVIVIYPIGLHSNYPYLAGFVKAANEILRPYVFRKSIY